MFSFFSETKRDLSYLIPKFFITNLKHSNQALGYCFRLYKAFFIWCPSPSTKSWVNIGGASIYTSSLICPWRKACFYIELIKVPLIFHGKAFHFALRTTSFSVLGNTNVYRVVLKLIEYETIFPHSTNS